MSWTRSIAPWSFLLILLTGCPGEGSDMDTDAGDAANDDAPATGGGECVPGQSIACACPDGSMGAQTCDAQGEGFGMCECTADTTTTTTGSTEPDPTGSGMDEDSGSEDTGLPAVSFEQDVKPILLASCGGMVNGCHDRGAYAANAEFDCRGWVAFEDAAIGSEIYAGPDAGMPTGCPDTPLYERLLELNSWQCGPGNPGPGLPVVVPGDPAASYLMMKIYGMDLCMIGADPSLVMPPPGEGFSISDEQIAILEAWILDGAPNN